jgi:WD40 repeat protein
MPGQKVREFGERKSWIKSAIFSKDGQIVATASEDGKVRIWNFAGKLIYEFIDNKQN